MERKNVLDGISMESIEKMTPCFKPVIKTFRSGETILSYSSDQEHNIAFIKEGTARLELISAEGSVFLLEKYKAGDIFGDIFSLPLDAYEYLITAETDCTTVSVDFEHVVAPCSNVCGHHSRLISNLFVMSAQKMQELSFHISVLGQPSIRAKLITYLRHIRSMELKNRKSDKGIKPTAIVFTLPMSLSQLAEYIHVERTSMMREIRLMKDDGILDSDKREFRLMV